MNNPFEYTPDDACREAFQRLTDSLEALKLSDNPADLNFIRELEGGKMLGVLIADDPEGHRHTLFAFSGQLGNGGFYHEGFVGPVFDYLQPDGYFKTNERAISRQNSDISLFETDTLLPLQADYDHLRSVHEAELARFKEICRKSKLERDAKRAAGNADEALLIRQSQFEKAELHRLKRSLAASSAPLEARLQEARRTLAAMKKKRHADSEALQDWLFSNFTLLNARGERRSVGEIFAATPMRIPPSGAGECCAPKLLQAAYLNGWRPLSIAEYWYGRPKEGEVRIHGAHYPACRGKCLPVLSWMLQGLDIYPPLSNDNHTLDTHTPEILFENEWFCVVDKPSGMLSVPGKGALLSVQEWLQSRYGDERIVKMAHRLDQDTSGLLIATFGDLPFRIMQSLFATRRVSKTYVADLDGDYRQHGLPPHGTISLPLSPDFLDRPRQKVDRERGKEAVTDYEFIRVTDGCSRVLFHPHTGRTHQLRVHSASDEGLGMPITGDRLYSREGCASTRRLHLHAHKIEFIFPLDRKTYSFESPVPF
jgi:tRNA pseudouridine32 synthase/23S rRNA pseudouridine746 synthase